MIPVVIATRNAHKTREFAELLGGAFAVSDLSSHPEIPPVDETGNTFEENATLKAVAVSQRIGSLVLADDSGLEVDALGKAPGVYSARYAGAGASDDANIAKLLAELRAVSAPRLARFRCVLVLARNGSAVAHFTGVIQGEIVARARGMNGFGYDPVFVPAGRQETFAQLGSATKNEISHRARAVAQLRRYLVELSPG